MACLIPIIPILNIIGTFEGYVPTETDLYLRGDNFAGMIGTPPTYVIFETGQIDTKHSYILYNSNKAINLTGYTRLNIECDILCAGRVGNKISLYFDDTQNPSNTTAITTLTYEKGTILKLIQLPFNYAATKFIAVRFSATDSGGYSGDIGGIIYRIWLS